MARQDLTMATSITHLNPPKDAAPLHLPVAGSFRKLNGTEGHTIRVSTCYTWKQVEKQIPAWEAILRDNQSLSIFSTPEWLGSWWKAFGQNKQVMSLALSNEDDSLVGLIPCYLEEHKSPFLGKLAWLRFIGDGSGDSDNLDLIIRPGFERECAQALMRWLKDHQDWDICSFNAMPDSSKAVADLMEELTRANWTCMAENSPCSAIPLPTSWPLYLESLSPAFRPLVTRYPRKLAQRYQVRIHRCDSLDVLSRRLEILFSLHEKRWNLVNQPGSFGARERREFYRLMGESFLRKGWLEFWLMELSGAPAATQYCFRYKDTVYILQEGFDPRFAADKAGYALRGDMLKHFIETGVKRYDFLGGFAPHKQNWGAKPGVYLNLSFARPGSRGSVYLSCTNSLAKSKEWLRGTLPAPAWNFLHWVKLKSGGQADAAVS
jgi:CelD/BcsL family acetyltransferase involved in cellulose biosynthesis